MRKTKHGSGFPGLFTLGFLEPPRVIRCKRSMNLDGVTSNRNVVQLTLELYGGRGADPPPMPSKDLSMTLILPNITTHGLPLTGSLFTTQSTNTYFVCFMCYTLCLQRSKQRKTDVLSNCHNCPKKFPI